MSIEQSLVSLGSTWSYRVEREQDRTFQSLETNRFLQVRRRREQDRLGMGLRTREGYSFKRERFIYTYAGRYKQTVTKTAQAPPSWSSQ